MKRFHSCPLAALFITTACAPGGGPGGDGGSPEDASAVTVLVESAVLQPVLDATLPSGDYFLVVDVSVSNAADGDPIPVGAAQFWVETDDGLIHPAAVVSFDLENECTQSALLAEGATTRCSVVFEPPSGSEPVAIRFFLGDGTESEFLRATFEAVVEELECEASLRGTCDETNEFGAYFDCVNTECGSEHQDIEECCADSGIDFELQCESEDDSCACALQSCDPQCAPAAVAYRDCYNTCASDSCT